VHDYDSAHVHVLEYPITRNATNYDTNVNLMDVQSIAVLSLHVISQYISVIG